MRHMKNFFYLLVGSWIFPLVASAAEEAASGGGAGLAGIGVGLGMGLAVLGGSIGQGKVGTAFMEGASRNPGATKAMFVPMMLALVFIETLVLFTFALMFMLQGKV